MKLVTFLAFLAGAQGFSLAPVKSSGTALHGSMLPSMEPHCDIVGQQGGGNLVEDKGWATVQGGSGVDWSVGASTPPQDEEHFGQESAVPQLYDVVGNQGLVLTAQQEDMTVQGGSVVDWNDKQFMNGN